MKLNSYSSRKFIFGFIGIGLFSFAFFFTKKLDAGNFVLGICSIIGMYYGANVTTSLRNK